MTKADSMFPRRPPDMELLGLPFHKAGMAEVHAFIEAVIQKKQKAIALNLNVHCVNLALKHPWLYDFIKNSAHLVFCDGDGVRLGLRMMGYQPPPKITYNEWIWHLAQFCEDKHYRIYLLGGKPGVAEEAAGRLKARFPCLEIAGVHHGYFSKEGEENQGVMEEINRDAPDILLVCFGMPAQEKWIMENWRQLAVHVFLKGGAALDYASGRLKAAPSWMVRGHFEWLFRLMQEPGRLFGRYVIGNPIFLGRVFCDRMKAGFFKKETGSR